MINPGDLWYDGWQHINQSLFQLALTNNNSQIFALYVWTDGHREMYISSIANFTQCCQLLIRT